MSKGQQHRAKNVGVSVESHVPAVDSPDSMLDMRTHLSSPHITIAIRENVESDDSRRLAVNIHKDDFIALFRTALPGFLERGGSSIQSMMMDLAQDAPDCPGCPECDEDDESDD